MSHDHTLAPDRPPRGMILSTGEDVPQGQSLRARMLVVEVGPKDVDLVALTRCQSDAGDGHYAAAMSAYVRWLAGIDIESRKCRVCRVWDTLGAEIATFRAQAMGTGMHGRTPELTANLAIGLINFLAFAVDVEAIPENECHALWDRGWSALLLASKAQNRHQAASDPAKRFLELVGSALATGLAHLAQQDGRTPPQPQASGWHKPSGNGNGKWHPSGARIGWRHDDFIYLDPHASMKAAQESAGDGEKIAIHPRTLHKRLHEAGVLIKESSRDDLLVRRTVEGVKRRLLCLRTESLILV